MKYRLLIIIVFVYAGTAAAQGNRRLAQEILADKKLDTVRLMAERLLAVLTGSPGEAVISGAAPVCWQKP
ncbi:MAG: hypothetical protein KF862_20090 [Chitinophagaceae bacterium]|nr:hypothetical protein [Chitinophagaceae bacterium]